MHPEEYLKALKAVLRMHTLEGTSPEHHALAVQLAVESQSQGSPCPAKLQALIRTELEPILPLGSSSSSSSLEHINSHLLQAHPHDAAAVLASCQAAWTISGGKDVEDVVQLAAQATLPENKPTLQVRQKTGCSRTLSDEEPR